MFTEGGLVKIIATGKLASILTLAVSAKETLAYLIEVEDENIHHFLPTTELEIS